MALDFRLLDDGEIVELARTMTDDETAEVGRWSVEPVDYAFGSPTTGGLFRIRGTARGAAAEVPWSLFVKLVRSYRHWPLLDVLPPPLRRRALDGIAWRYEADVYTAGLGDALPAGLRLPHVHRARTSAMTGSPSCSRTSAPVRRPGTPPASRTRRSSSAASRRG